MKSLFFPNLTHRHTQYPLEQFLLNCKIYGSEILRPSTFCDSTHTPSLALVAE